MSKPKAIQIYTDWYQQLKLLNNEQVGRLMMGLLEFALSDEKPQFGDDKLLEVLSISYVQQLSRDLERYQEICEKRSQSGRKGGEKRAQANGSKSKQMLTNDSKSKQYKEKEKEKYKEKYNILCRVNSTARESDYASVVDYLNRKAGTRYRSDSKATMLLIADRMDEGYTVDDFKTVIDKKCDSWLHTEYSRFLRPQTLFSAKHFEEYLNEPPKKVNADFTHFENNSFDVSKLDEQTLFED